MYKTIGYYICGLIETPEFVGFRNEWMLSVSECFGGVHPDLSCCYFQNNLRNQRMEYRKKLNLKDNIFDKMQKEIGDMFEKELAIDGRFLNLTDAQYFCSHSFLCNHLHKELPTARFNQYGLLDNSFEEVIEFSNQIEGKGEPVEWIPCRIGSCSKV